MQRMMLAQAWKDLEEYSINQQDVLVGIAASGRTPYVIGGLKDARANGITTGCIVCNSNSEVAKQADFPIEVVVGPEFVTGSTRMKSGTAQKLVLNMISTTVMIKLGHVKGNKMVDMQLTNQQAGRPRDKDDHGRDRCFLRRSGTITKTIRFCEKSCGQLAEPCTRLNPIITG